MVKWVAAETACVQRNLVDVEPGGGPEVKEFSDLDLSSVPAVLYVSFVVLDKALQGRWMAAFTVVL